LINNPLFHYNLADFQYQYAMDADSGYGGSDPYDAVYKDLSKKHYVMKKVKKKHLFCHAKRFPGAGLAFCCRACFLLQGYSRDTG